MLEIRGLTASIGDKPILNGIDLTLPDGEVHAITGKRGYRFRAPGFDDQFFTHGRTGAAGLRE